MRSPAARPCGSCPYRRDVPSGVWAPEEYAKLPAYDRATPFQPPAVFLCHLLGWEGEQVCAGWVGCHDPAHLLALRIAESDGRLTGEEMDEIVDYVSPVPLFESGQEAADHGLADVEAPGPDATDAMGKIIRTRRRR